MPKKVTVDKSGSNKAALERIKPMLGFKSFLRQGSTLGSIKYRRNRSMNTSKHLSKIPKSVKLNPNLFIQALSASHSKELFSLTDKNRTYLRKWLPWVDSCTTESETLNFISRTKDAVSKNSGLTFGIFYNQKIAGTISFNQIDWSSGEADIGYWIGEAFQGLGLVTSACSKLIEIGFQALDLKKIAISCALENTKSQGIPIRLGFKKSEVVPKKQKLYESYVDHIIYTICSVRSGQ